MKSKIRRMIYIFLIALVAVILGCAQQPAGVTITPQEQQQTQEKQIKETEVKKTIIFGLPPWPGVTVKNEIVRILLEDTGYEVEINKLDIGIVYGELTSGNLDALLAGWLPVTHENYWNEHGDSLEKVKVNIAETWLGLAVPTYVYEEGIQSIADLAGSADKFDSRIVGIEPGAGIMQSTEKAIETYSLDEYDLKSSSTPAMMAEVDASIRENEWVVFTIWEPHSAFARFDIQKLADPEEVYGGGDAVYTIVRQDFKEDFPKVYQFFKQFEVPPQTQSEWILEYSDKERDPAEVAIEWIENNQDKVSEWRDVLEQ